MGDVRNWDPFYENKIRKGGILDLQDESDYFFLKCWAVSMMPEACVWTCLKLKVEFFPIPPFHQMCEGTYRGYLESCV